MNEKLINPMDYLRENNPEALDFMVGSGMDLSVEVALMIARSEKEGRRYHDSDDFGEVLVPEDICVAILEGSESEYDMRVEAGLL